MRSSRTFLFTVATLAWPIAAAAQAGAPAPTPQAAAPAAAVAPAPLGFIDIGVRNTSTDGDAARYERYRDLGDGLFIETFRWQRESRGFFTNLAADHVGREDQRYTLDVVNPGRLKSWFQYDQIPMLLSRTTQTLFSDSIPQELTIVDALQAQVQANPASMDAVFAANAVTFDTETKRRIAGGAAEFMMTSALTFKARVQHSEKSGSIPYGGSFGHSSLVEMPLPMRHGLTDVDAGAEWQQGRWLFRGAYTGSWFSNDFQTQTFDNPFRATDSLAIPSRGRLSVAPDNSFVGVNGMASVTLPYRTRVTGYVSVASLHDGGDPIMPQTINSTVTTAPIDRLTVEGEARTTSVNLNVVSRPSPKLDLTARYRTYDYDNRTPEFAMTQRVSYDNAAVPVNPAVDTEPFSVNRGTLDADARYTPGGRFTAGVGYSWIGEERTHRVFDSTTDHVVRLTADLVGQRWLTFRTKYEHAQRRGTGVEEGEAELLAIGEQPGMRHYDVAQRNRNRVTFLTSVTPGGSISYWGSVAAGKDDFIESEFGLRDNGHRVYSIGIDAVPGDRFLLGASYAYEKYTALSRSRQANPGPQFNDPSRNWATDAADKAHSVRVNLEIRDLIPKLDVRFNYDYSHSRSLYHYITGPVEDRTLPEEVIVESTLPAPTQLPPTLSELHMATTDFTYNLNARVGIGLSFWYERYRVEDFTLDIDANPDLSRGSVLLMGYLYTPYTARTVWLRMYYRF